MQNGFSTHIFSLNHRICDIGPVEIVILQQIPGQISVGAARCGILQKIFHQAAGSKGFAAHICKEQMAAVVRRVPENILLKLNIQL